MSLILKKVVLSLFAIVLAILLVEGGVRYAGFKPSPPPLIYFSVFNDNPERLLAEKGLNYSNTRGVVYLTDNQTFWKFKPNSKINLDPDKKVWGYENYYQINSQGFRGEEFSVKKPNNTFRIIAVGDSVTFGLLLPREKTYFKLLQAKLNQSLKSLNVEVISAGIPGYTSYQGRQLLEKELLSYSPDMIIVYFAGINETNENYYTDRQYAQIIMSTPLKKLSEKSAALGLLISAAQKIKLFPPFPTINREKRSFRVPLPEFKDDLTKIVNLTRKFNIIPVLVVPPHSSPYSKIADDYASAVRSFSDVAPIADVDLEFKKRDTDRLFNQDLIHPNQAGHQIIANMLYDTIVKKVKNKFNSN